MQRPSNRASRRVALVSTALSGLGLVRRSAAKQAPPDYPVHELLTLLPHLREDLSVRVWRLSLSPGTSSGARYQGMASMMVRSGTLTVPLTLEKTMKMMAVSPTLPYLNDEGTPVSSHTSGPVKRPNFPPNTGVIAEDGNFGVIENNGNEDLDLIIVESYPQSPIGTPVAQA